MKTGSFFDTFIFPVLDWSQLDYTRHACAQMSAAVRSITGYWIHPAWWQVDAVLLVALCGLLAWRKFAPTTALPHHHKNPGTAG